MLDYTNKKVLIMGLGLNQGGVGAVRFFLKQRARVSVTDIKPRRFLLPSVRKISEFQKKLGTSVQPVRYILGRHQKRDFTNADIVIKGPGVSQNSPFLKLLRKRRIPIETDVGIFFKYCPAPIIGITGSKGKSTTASLIADILRGISSDVVLAGNIGTSCLDSLDRITPNTKVVLELSSWQLEDLKRIKKSPAISVITNVLKEHLNRYKNFKAYAEAKSLICAFQKKNEYCIVHTSAKAVLLPFLRKSQANVLFFQTQKKHSVRLRVSNQALRGEHNLANIEAATRVSKLLHIPNIKIKKALQNYKGLTGREESYIIMIPPLPCRMPRSLH
ncbi:MAG: hypothetical protein HYW88_00640 [Candidatus Sungbacteria bacterium]|nr:hypothetical protein [Candidatus Sungbacteria bacterium]